MSELRTRIKHEQGQSLVEFSLGAVLLLILLAGVVDATRALFTYMALRDAAQEGASYGAMNADISKPAVRYQIVSRICKGSNMFQNVSCNDITIDSSAAITVQLTAIGPACSGNSLTVRLRYDRFPLTMPFLGTILGSQTVPISTSITDTILQPIECP